MSTQTVRIDDLDGESRGAQPLTFALEGVTYDIDLIEENAEALRQALAPFIKVAQARQKPAAKAEKRMSREERRERREELADTRKWAHGVGYEFSDQGRIPKHIVEAYQKVGPGTKGTSDQ